MTPSLDVLSAAQLAKLACPQCGGSLAYANASLTCDNGHGFEVANGVPVLLREETRPNIERARQRAENVQLRRSMHQHPTLLGWVDRVRPPHPFSFMRWRASRRARAQFSAAAERDHVAADGAFLDIGSGILGGKNVSGLSEVIRARTIALEIDTVSGVGVVADAHYIPWQAGALDGVLIQGVLEHVEDPERVVAEIMRVLKPGAPVYAEVPFQQHYHLDPVDFRRWTTYGFDQLFKKFSRIESGVCAGPASALTDLLTEFPALLFTNPQAYWVVKTLSGWLFSPLQLLDAFWASRPRAHVAAGAVYFLGTKPLASR